MVRRYRRPQPLKSQPWVWEALVSPSQFVALPPAYLLSETVVHPNPVCPIILTRVSVGVVPGGEIPSFLALRGPFVSYQGRWQLLLIRRTLSALPAALQLQGDSEFETSADSAETLVKVARVLNVN